MCHVSRIMCHGTCCLKIVDTYIYELVYKDKSLSTDSISLQGVDCFHRGCTEVAPKIRIGKAISASFIIRFESN